MQKNKSDLISIIIPVYKVEKYLDRCLQSVLNQNYKNIEVILVDDGSPDNCPKICDEWAKKDKRIKVIHKQNGGVSSARNEGLKIATGEYICFVDSDDEVLPNYCEDLLNALKDNNADMAMGSIIDMPKNVIIVQPKKDFVCDLKNKKDFLKMFEQTAFGLPSNKIFKKEKINFEFDTSFSYGEDFLFNLEYFNNIEKLAIIKKPVYLYYVYESSLSHNDGIDIYKKNVKINEKRYSLLYKILKDEKYTGYCNGAQLLRNLYYGFTKLYLSGTTKDILQQKFDEVCNNKDVQWSLDKFYPKNIKTRLIYRSFKTKKLNKLLFIVKTKKLIKKMLGK